jgi:hypothetical protein
VAISRDRLWDEAVVLQTPRRLVTVSSSRDAVIFLRKYWRGRKEELHGCALEVCQRSICGLAHPDAARQAFISAARKAGFTVKSWI